MVLAAAVLSGADCPAPLQIGLPSETGGRVTLRIENQSGLPVTVEAEFTLADNQVRRTMRQLEPVGAESAVTVLTTTANRVEVIATASEPLPESPNALVAPGDMLAQGTFIWQVDFPDGGTINFVIPPLPEPPPGDIIDCNSNGVSDILDLAAGESLDCNGNGTPDECDIAAGASQDCQGNGIPDECDISIAAVRSAARVASAESLLFPPDAGFVTAMAPNDDGSTAEIPLGFSFELYGITYTSAFINNNGNLSFGGPFSEFTSTGFPVGGFPMIAPFWADIDTRSGLGTVRYKLQPGLLVVVWENVGYFDRQGDKRNTFQVAISDCMDPVIGMDFNVAFSYGDMQWTTGQASGGAGGFGGTPATVGANAGNGIDFFQIGRFDHPGADYDGPTSANDGVDYLDYQTFRFKTATQTFNIAPIASNFPAQTVITLDARLGEQLDIAWQFLSPEAGQTTDVTLDDPNDARSAGLECLVVPGNVATVQLTWTPECADSGVYPLAFHAADDFVPPGTTLANLTVVVRCTSEDCNGNGTPDECEPDCNSNGIADPCDIAGQPDLDADTNGILDECE